MKFINKKEIIIVNSILTDAFANNQSVNYLLKREKDKSLISKLMDYSLEKAKLYGHIYLNENNNACCILLDPKKVKNQFVFRSLWLDIKLIFTVVGIKNLKKVSNKEHVTKKYLPKDIDYIHLWFIGVESSMQGKGVGYKFMNEIIDYYSGIKEAICLETSTLINLPFYKKLGFEIYHKENFGFDFYFLIKYL